MTRLRSVLASLFTRFIGWRNNLRRRYLSARGRLSLYDTMGAYKALQAMPDDKGPNLRKPDPNAPHAALINRVRLYAKNGAKALGPLLDKPLPVVVAPTIEEAEGMTQLDVDLRLVNAGQIDWVTVFSVVAQIETAAGPTDFEGGSIARAISCAGLDDEPMDAVRAVHRAYNSPWTVKDGEVWEVVTD